MRTVTLCLNERGEPCVFLPHGRKGEPAPYPVRFGAGGAVILTSPEGAVYEVSRRGGLLRCTCPAWKYGGGKRCKHAEAAVLLIQWLDAVSAHDGYAPTA